MLLSDAIDRIGKMLDACPHGRPANQKSYIGALASVLCQYPRMVAEKCADPLRGVLRERDFLPTVGSLVAFCERESGFLRGAVDRGDAEEKAKRESEQREAEAARLAEERKTRPTLQQMQDQHGTNWGIGIAAKQDLLVRQARDKTMAEANRRAFVAECEASGVDPSEGVSPSLRHIIEEQNATRAVMIQDEEQAEVA